MTLPGTHLLAIARLWFDEATVSTVFEPLVADWQREYLGAPTPRARHVRYWCGAYSFAAAVARCAPRVLFASHSGPDIRTSVMAIAGFSMLGTALNLLLWDWPSNLTRYPYASWPFLAPAFIVSSAPYAMLPLALVISARTRHRRQARTLILQMTAAQVVLVVLVGGWLVPKTNQEYRTIVAASFKNAARATGASYRSAPALREALSKQRRAISTRAQGTPVSAAPARGVNELTTWELFTQTSLPPDVHASWAQVVSGRHERAALAILPLVLAMLGWGLGGLSDRAARVRALMWWAFACAVVAVLRSGTIMFEQTYGWPSQVVIWLPIALFLAAALAVRRPPRIPDPQEA